MSASELPSDTVLHEATGRAVTLLKAVGTRPPIRRAMQALGFEEADRLRGWALVRAASEIPNDTLVDVDRVVMGAVTQLDALDEDLYANVSAILSEEFPNQLEWLTRGLGPKIGFAAVRSVESLLGRIASMPTAPDRADFRAQDQAALAELARLKHGPERWAELAALVATAQSSGTGELPPDQTEALRAAELAVYRWHHKWAVLARRAITKRSYLIALGLAERRSSEKPASSAP